MSKIYLVILDDFPLAAYTEEVEANTCVMALRARHTGDSRYYWARTVPLNPKELVDL